jgi:hypothetical protein
LHAKNFQALDEGFASVGGRRRWKFNVGNLEGGGGE